MIAMLVWIAVAALTVLASYVLCRQRIEHPKVWLALWVLMSAVYIAADLTLA